MLRTALAALAVAAVTTGLLPAAHATSGTTGETTRAAVSGKPLTAQVDEQSARAIRCADPLLRSARPAWKVERDRPRTFAAAARVNGRATADLAAMAQDRSLWLDSCGRRLYVEQAPDVAVAPASGVTSGALPADVLALSSRPGASRSIYLDFTGDVLTGTYWNDELGLASIPMDPFSLDGTVDTAFSADERRAIYETWLVVAEDYAPFDVDVTTADPGPGALRRDSWSDTTYGSRVLVTDGGLINDWCQGCGGVAVVDVFDLVGDHHDYTQPALAFSGSVAGHGPWIGEVSSHEVGHHLALEHDGRTTSSYYSGHGPWGPVMGAPYDRALSQWSRGEYAGADNQQDDLALLAAGLSFRGDDHGDAATPTLLEPGTPQAGVISRPGDIDSFAFSAAGSTTVTVRPTSPFSNLDLRMTVLGPDGDVVAQSDPAVSVDRSGTVSGLGATWQVVLPEVATDHTVLLDGVGHGDPAAGGYSDYGSLGAYEVRLSTQPPARLPEVEVTAEPSPEPEPTPEPTPAPSPEPEPTAGPEPVLTRTLELPTTRLAPARLRTRYQVRITAAGGSGRYQWLLKGDLPRGLRARVSADGTALLLKGRPSRLGRTRFGVVVRDDEGQRVLRRYVVRVRRQA